MLTNGNNVEVNTGKVLIVANKENVKYNLNGILNVLEAPAVIILLQLVVAINGNNVVEKHGKELDVA